MRVTGVAVFAGKFATAVRINRPGKRHALDCAAVQQGTHWQREIFDFMALAQRFAFCCQARNADQLWPGVGNQGKGSQIDIGLLFAI
jgi:hypothetical protein